MIVAHAPKTYFGSGDIQKSLGSLPGFPWAKYPGEKHLPGHNYTGRGTRLDLRLDENNKPKPGEEPVNRVDAAALKHDILYRNKDIKFRHEADKQMIIELENIPNPTFKERMERALIIKLLKAKMKLGTDCIDQMLQRLGKVDQKRLTLISHNGSGFDNWIALQNVKKLTQCPLVVDNKILSFPLSNPYTEERLQKKWKRQKEIMSNSNYLQNISFTCSFIHQSTSLAAWGNSSNLPMNLKKITDVNIAKFTKETWESLRPE
ncbi:hypothetical protein LOTGIDRAFT_174996 [Lottia gigantea]|uniref:Phospholipase A2-like domain-containing protein n=1 Tax=Lottia gigantea TaxID=225164 RepID=V4AMI4_LOTGI|nr:hypothetical protein LOTGIDRAFT_174996 [Lottia gigantea]ESO95975.1 hypothetical protein LOTGIDRAFT_174996 [Lottia gigantea]